MDIESAQQDYVDVDSDIVPFTVCLAEFENIPEVQYRSVHSHSLTFMYGNAPG